MHFFDPTLDWPKDLLEETVPDLIVVRSKSLLNANALWNQSSGNASWTTPWIQYAVADDGEDFLNMIFFDSQSPGAADGKLILEYLKALSNEQIPFSRYKCTSAKRQCSTILAKSEWSNQQNDSKD